MITNLGRKGTYLFVLICIVLISGLELYSTEWARLKLIQYYLDRKNYEIAEEIGMKVIRKRSLAGPLTRKIVEKIGVKWDNAMTLFIEKEVTLAQDEWNSSRSFFAIKRTLLDKLDFRYKTFQALFQPTLLKELNSYKRFNKLVSNLMPYSVETGYLENDIIPELGALSFNCSGGVALDYNLRSIGANLGVKKSVAAIRLRRSAEETRVAPENLSLWISDDNKRYSRYTGKIIFTNGNRSITLDTLNISCQYVKIHCNFKDDKFTLAEDFKSILEIYGPPDFS